MWMGNRIAINRTQMTLIFMIFPITGFLTIDNRFARNAERRGFATPSLCGIEVKWLSWVREKTGNYLAPFIKLLISLTPDFSRISVKLIIHNM